MNSIAGKLLVASPRLLDPNFYRAVVLIFVHDETDGALGLVLNREIDEPAERYLPEWADRISKPGLIHYGGPVEPEVAIGLGRASDGKGIGAAGLEMIDLTEPPNPDSPTVKVYSGYSGWAPGQLEAELEEGSWFVLDAAPDDPFGRTETLWQRVLQRQPGILAILSTYPDNPRWN